MSPCGFLISFTLNTLLDHGHDCYKESIQSPNRHCSGKVVFSVKDIPKEHIILDWGSGKKYFQQ